MHADVLNVLKRNVIIPVVREHDADRARLVIRSLRRVGFRVFEVTMTVPGAFDLISDLSEEEGLTVGAGTVLSADEARRAAVAGASFVVSPAGIAEVAEAAHAGGAAVILGALTPSEVVAARRMGADAIKIFPADSVGGPKHVKALGTVFPDLPFIPTGGVDADNLRAHLEAGAHSVGVGSALSRGRDATEIEASGRRYLDTLETLTPQGRKETP